MKAKHLVGLHRLDPTRHRHCHMGVDVLAHAVERLRKFYPHCLNVMIEAICCHFYFQGLLPKKLRDVFSQCNIVLESDVKVVWNFFKNLRYFSMQEVSILIDQREPENPFVLRHCRKR